MGVPDASGACGMGGTRVGIAVLERPGSFRALRRTAGQEKHKKITDWAWQMLLLMRRWWPERQIVAVADGTYASLKLLDRCRSLGQPVTFITRLRLDAALYEPAPPCRPGQLGHPRLKGEQLPNLSVVAEDSSAAWRSITR